MLDQLLEPEFRSYKDQKMIRRLSNPNGQNTSKQNWKITYRDKLLLYHISI